MNLLEKLEEAICDTEGIAALLTLSGLSVNDSTASSAMIYAANAVRRFKIVLEDIESDISDMLDTIKGVTQ